MTSFYFKNWLAVGCLATLLLVPQSHANTITLITDTNANGGYAINGDGSFENASGSSPAPLAASGSFARWPGANLTGDTTFGPTAGNHPASLAVASNNVWYSGGAVKTANSWGAVSFPAAADGSQGLLLHAFSGYQGAVFQKVTVPAGTTKVDVALSASYRPSNSPTLQLILGGDPKQYGALTGSTDSGWIGGTQIGADITNAGLSTSSWTVVTRSLTLASSPAANTDMWFALVNPLTSGDNSIYIDKLSLVATVPEPTALSLLAGGLAMLMTRRRRR